MATKPPILLVHGACSQAAHMDVWRTFFEGAGHEVRAPSLPGHAAGAFRALRRLRLADHVDAIAARASRFERPPVLVGHSMGGLVAQAVAARQPVAALVLVASVPPGYLPTTLGAIPWFVTAAPQVILGLPFRPTRAGLRHLALSGLGRGEQDAILPDFVAESGGVYREMILGRLRVPAGAVRCPVLVLHGDRDRLVPLRAARRLARRYRAALIEVGDAGHWLIAPSLVPAVAGRIAAWLAGLPGSA